MDQELIAAKRERKRVTRIRKLRDERISGTEVKGDLRPYRSRILSLFGGETDEDRRKAPAKIFIAPQVFSISRNAAECIKFFQDIVKYVRSSRRPRIVLDQRKIKYLGLGADSVLGVILSEIKLELRFVYGTYIRGFKPKDRSIQQIMDEVGSVRALFMEAEEDVRISFFSKSKVFRHRHKSSSSGESSASFDPAGAAVTDFSDHLSDCLGIVGRSLSASGRDKFCQYTAEIVDNVKEHAGLEEWAIVGYTDSGSSAPVYRSVIFCFGKTIAETFQDLDELSVPWQTIKPYIDAHKGGSLFTADWREEDLITLVSLQGGISSKSTEEDPDRGQGTVELINFFQDVRSECDFRNVPAEMNIISGSTRVSFDGSYSMEMIEGLNREVIAFNADNDLRLPPDRRAVGVLKGAFFPGTLITIEMPLVTSVLTDGDLP